MCGFKLGYGVRKEDHFAIHRRCQSGITIQLKISRKKKRNYLGNYIGL